VGANHVRLLTDAGPGTVRVGTSGWSYREWIGPFYPPGTTASKMLPFYAEQFAAVEAHSTFRRVPTAGAVERWSAQVPPAFRFATKAHAAITHRRDLEGLSDRVAAFFAALRPLAGRLGPVLFALPHRRPDLVRLDALLSALRAADTLGAAPVFELARAWSVEPPVLESLVAAGADDAFVRAAPVAYVRLRRARYSRGALADWAERLTRAARRGQDVYAFVKHDERGESPRYARELVRHLEPR
jgi:uncharacterized protein YecE (DUF72 family)